MAFSWISCIVRLTNAKFNKEGWGGAEHRVWRTVPLGFVYLAIDISKPNALGVCSGAEGKRTALMDKAHKSLSLEFLAILLTLEIFPTVAVFKYSPEATILLRCD